MIPSKRQWAKWTLPSKASYVGFLMGIISLLITIALAFYSKDKPLVITAQPERIRPQSGYFIITATGYGKPPADLTSDRENRYLALLAARIAAKRDLTAYIRGTEVESVTVISGQSVDHDTIVNIVKGKVPPFTIVEEKYDDQKKEAEVTLQLRVSEND